jgi:hypothetical protein
MKKHKLTEEQIFGELSNLIQKLFKKSGLGFFASDKDQAERDYIKKAIYFPLRREAILKG